MPVAKKERNEYACIKCKHTWFKTTLTDSLPRICPKCKTTYWNSDELKEPYKNAPTLKVTPPVPVENVDQKDGGDVSTLKKDEEEPSSYSKNKREAPMKKEIVIQEAEIESEQSSSKAYDDMPYECPDCRARFDALENGRCPNPDCNAELEGI
jgi:Zn finger protein HypA/HybF involved in hydrogenase expression